MLVIVIVVQNKQNWSGRNLPKEITCTKCAGTGKITEGAKFTGHSSQCTSCGFVALGATQVKQFQKRGNLCRECSGDHKYD